MHDPGHKPHEPGGKNLGFAIFLNLLMTLVEAAGGIIREALP